jgi:hypothetical protein
LTPGELQKITDGAGRLDQVNAGLREQGLWYRVEGGGQ